MRKGVLGAFRTVPPGGGGSFGCPRTRHRLIVATGPQPRAATVLGSLSGEMKAMKKGNNLASSIRLGLALLIIGAFALWLLPSRVSATSPRNVDWPNHGNDLHNTRFQDVDQINKSNVRSLRPAWVFHTKVLDPLSELQASPIVINGRMFVTDGHDDVFALDAATGKELWSYEPLKTDDMPPIEQMIVCCGRNNKGVAFADGKVIYGRLDNVVVALNAESGRVMWKTRLANTGTGFAINNAPRELWLPEDRPVQARRRGGVEPGRHRSGSEAGLHADRKCGPGHSRRGPSGRQSVCHLDHLSRPAHREARVAFPGGAPRHLGLRQRAARFAVPPHQGREVLEGARPLQQERAVLHPRPAQRRSNLPRGRGARSAGPGVPARRAHPAILGRGRAADSADVRETERHRLPRHAAIHAARREGVRHGAR